MRVKCVLGVVMREVGRGLAAPQRQAYLESPDNLLNPRDRRRLGASECRSSFGPRWWYGYAPHLLPGPTFYFPA